MKVIKEGKRVKGNIFYHVCDRCEAEFEYNMCDVDDRTVLDLDGVMGVEYHLRCPCCGYDIVVDMDKDSV